MVIINSYLQNRKGGGRAIITNPPHFCRSICDAAIPYLTKTPPTIIFRSIFVTEILKFYYQNLLEILPPQTPSHKYMLHPPQYNLNQLLVTPFLIHHLYLILLSHVLFKYWLIKIENILLVFLEPSSDKIDHYE